MLNFTKLEEKPISLQSDSYWLKLRTQNNSIEGKFYGGPTDKELVIFQPGFPGGAARDLEEWHFPELLTRDRSIFTVRHNGTILDGKHSSYYINCPERLEQASIKKEHVLGKEQATLATWLEEPLVALEALAENFETIILVGHSFGCLSLAWCLVTADKALFEKVGKIVFLAGSLGRIRSGKLEDPVLQDWRHHLDTDWIRERVEIGSVEENLKTLLKANTTIHDEISKFPAIDPILLHPWGDTPDSIDERIHIQESLDFIVSLGRGYLIVDKTQKPNAEKGAAVHDLPNLKTAFLSKLFEPDYKPESRLTALI